MTLGVAGLWNAAALGTNDFEFKAGKDNTPASWNPAPASQSITVRPGAGQRGSDRVTLIWSNNPIQKTWLQITVRATANTGLPTPGLFYFGNAIGESGNSAADAKVTTADSLGVLNHATASATLTHHYDFNRDGKVDAADRLIMLNNQSGLASLRLIDLSGGGGRVAGGGLNLAEVTDPTVLPVTVERDPAGGLRVRVPAEAGPVRVLTAMAMAMDVSNWTELSIAPRLDPDSQTWEFVLPVDLQQPQRFFRFVSPASGQ